VLTGLNRRADPSGNGLSGQMPFCTGAWDEEYTEAYDKVN